MFRTYILDSGTILGSGEFSIVVAGQWKTKQNMKIAVKIPKLTNDTEYFKAILSEVKVMIYVGETANVVNLLGVCTQDIRNRNVHIILEFCENGSLRSLLRKCKANYLNLLECGDAEWESDGNKAKEGCVTTLDLIRWAAEIANGMNCLSMKRV
jgi:serine/threonine protein kinase